MSVSSVVVPQKRCIRFQDFERGDTAWPHLWEQQGHLDSNKGTFVYQNISGGP